MWAIPFYFLLLIYCLLILWYRKAWQEIPASATGDKPQAHHTSVTVIVPARNEAPGIAQCIESILNQNYPVHLLQVLIMDDASEDETAAIARSYQQQHPFIEVISLSPEEHLKAHKKQAIEKAVNLASGELIICTDADCKHPADWIASLVTQNEQSHKKFIAAPVMFYTKPTLLSIFQTLDFLSLQGITGASVYKNFHTMCNGANIAYSKAAFKEVNGFAGIDQLPTGDDMLLMHKIYKKYPNQVTWIKTQDALVLTDEADSWKTFFNQRIRWASKAAYYDDKRIFYVLLLVYLFNVSLFILGMASFFSMAVFYQFLLILAIKTLIELLFMIPVAMFFDKTKWIWYFPLMQPLHIIYTVIAGWLGKFGSYEWKGRRISH